MSPFSPGQDLFQTQADSRFNSFSNPINPVNMNPGSWGINSAYMTPAYLSPYRPSYQGPQGNPYASSHPSWASSVNYIVNPFRRGGDNYGGNYWQQSTPFYDAIGDRPVDQAGSFMQNYAVPIGASYGAMRFSAGFGNRVGAAVGSGAVRGLIGTSVAPATASWLMSGGRMVGGMAGSIAIPALMAQAAISTFDAAVMDPFVAQRTASNNLRQNFAGVTFGDYGTGSRYQTGGFNRRYAAGMASEMSQFAAKDLTFNQSEISSLMDKASRSGLLDNVSAKKITGKMKEITSQVKLIMSVANTLEDEAVEILSKLRLSGASGSTASRLMSQLGSFAAMGGISTQKLMNTVGVQGQYLFGASGLTPYVGQMAAGQSYAAMSSAYRSGLISPALAARMGGVEGATQSAVAGMVGMSQTPYVSMYANNAYLGGGASGNIVSNVTQFGGRMARGGLAAVGDYHMNRAAANSRLMEEKGISLVEDMIAQAGQLTPNSRNSKGQVKSGAAYMMLTGTYGLQDDQAIALLHQLRSYQNEDTRNTMLAGNQRSSIDANLKFMQQRGMDYGKITPQVQSVLGFGRSVQAGSAYMIGSALGTAGGAGDYVQNWWTEAKFGTAAASQGLTWEGFEGSQKRINLGNYERVNPIRKVMSYTPGGNLWNTEADLKRIANGSTVSSRNMGTLDSINKLAANGDKDAITAIGGSGTARRDALYNLAKSGKLAEEYVKPEEITKLLGDLDKQGIETLKNKGLHTTLGKMFGDVTGSSDILDKTVITKNVGILASSAEGSDEWERARRDLAGVLGRDVETFGRDAVNAYVNSDAGRASQKREIADWAGLSDKIGVKNGRELRDLVNKKYGGSFDNLARSTLKGEDLKRYLDNTVAGGEDKAYYAAVQAKNGGILVGPESDPTREGHLSTADLSERNRIQQVHNKQREFLIKMGNSHKIDFSAMEQGLAAIDSKEATGVFKDSVEEFSKAVGYFSSKNTDDTSPGLMTNFVSGFSGAGNHPRAKN